MKRRKGVVNVKNVKRQKFKLGSTTVILSSPVTMILSEVLQGSRHSEKNADSSKAIDDVNDSHLKPSFCDNGGF